MKLQANLRIEELTVRFIEDIRKQIPENFTPILNDLEKACAEFSKKATSYEFLYQQQNGKLQHLYNRYIDLIWIAYFVKFSELLRNLISAVNQNDFLIYGLVGRSIIEHTAILRHYCKTEINPIVQNALKNKIIEPNELQSLITILDRHLRGGRFHWEAFMNNDFDALFAGKKSSLKQESVGNCIKEWNKADPSIKVLYDLFCDLVHPNLGSTLLVARVWSDGVGIGGQKGYPAGREIFIKTIAGPLQVIQEVTKLLDGLLLLRLPEQN